jgi:hypothetical protein
MRMFRGSCNALAVSEFHTIEISEDFLQRSLPLFCDRGAMRHQSMMLSWLIVLAELADDRAANVMGPGLAVVPAEPNAGPHVASGYSKGGSSAGVITMPEPSP